MNIAVIGGSGFIGTSLVKNLMAKGHQVTIIDKETSKTFPDLCLKGDICHQAVVTRTLKEAKPDVIFHLAAEHRDDVKPTSLYYDVNVGGAEHICRAAEKLNINRIIFISSVAVYGPTVKGREPTDETQAPYPVSDYGHSKLQAEDIFRHWQSKGEGARRLSIIRPAAVFGPDSQGNVHTLIMQIAKKQFALIGNGQNKKSLAYLGNLVEFLTFILDNPEKDGVYNYVDEPTPTMRQLVNTIGKAIHGDQYRFITVPAFVGYLAGMTAEIVTFFIGKQFPLNRDRARKFCADTHFTAKKALSTGFKPPYDHTKAIKAKAKSVLSA